LQQYEHFGAAGHYDDWQDDSWRFQSSRRQDSLLAAAVKGAIAGLAGTAIVSVGLQVGPKLMERAGALPEGASDAEQPTEKLADTIAEGTFDTELTEGPRVAAGQAIHWGYGTAWGAVYGVAQRELNLPAPVAGALFGGLISGIASTIVPAMNLTPPPTEQPLAMNLFMGGINMVYGEAVAVVYDMLE
jgi:hypothetical protein